ncbi:carotenoid biosynthesis protein [Deinococcus radiophilus]|uniref:Carotenoid biosynthesis protein n=1 Tax=Deinococcus radiophilus TaxID=32062 RepID=A0A3S0RG40_9DEIO|nr:carotenoid biosynthesis protein [Deinococcus radiophilus]RTR27527.1 carotenoid biosynthesis protein [Deinococcus radiophilus]UFA50400.1 carotenoid biosynthesis protein [Deinococcus radiophilus]
MTPLLQRSLLAFAALGLAFAGVLLVLGLGQPLGWGLVALGLPLAGALALAGDHLGAGFGPTLRRRATALSRQTQPWLWLLALYLLLKVPVPLWPDGFMVLATLSTAALFASALLWAAERVGWARALGAAALCFGGGFAAEYLGSRTGIPFGDYTYAGAPGPTLLGVPLLVPLGWFALTLAALRLGGGRPLLAALLLVAWDVGLEPLMTAQGFWTWHDSKPLWAGAPLQNFLGWWAVGGALAWAVTRLTPELLRRERGPDLSWAYLTELFMLPGGLLLLGQPVAAGVTLVAMGTAALLARALAPSPARVAA